MTIYEIIDKWEKMEAATKIMKGGVLYQDNNIQKGLADELHTYALFLADLKKMDDCTNCKLLKDAYKMIVIKDLKNKGIQ